MSTNDIDYFHRRAQTELAMAQAATVPAAVQAHYELATHYLASLDRADRGAKAVERDGHRITPILAP